MPEYSVNFKNTTGQIWTMCVYQTLPNSPGLLSVAWQQTTAANNETTGVQWDVTYLACLGNYVQTGGIGVYTATQNVTTNLGVAYDIVMQSSGGSGPQVQSLVPTTDGSLTPPADGIYIRNISNNVASPGIGMSGSPSVFMQDVLDPEVAQYVVTPTYWVALFTDLSLGQVISNDATLGPWQLTFGPDQYTALLTASVSGNEIVTDITYSGPSTDVAAVNARIAAQRRRRTLSR